MSKVNDRQRALARSIGIWILQDHVPAGFIANQLAELVALEQAEANSDPHRVKQLALLLARQYADGWKQCDAVLGAAPALSDQEWAEANWMMFTTEATEFLTPKHETKTTE